MSSFVIQWPESPATGIATQTIATTGYKLYIDNGNDGEFRVLYDGTGFAGVNTFAVTNLTIGQLYRYKVSALNFNGEGVLSSEAQIYACLSPANFSEPTYVTSTENELTISWNAPQQQNGCPVYMY